MKKGEYHYSSHGNQFRIYVCKQADDKGSISEPVNSEPFYSDRETARKRVYELNNWKYTPRNNGTPS